MAYQYWSVIYANSSVLVPVQAETTVGVGIVIDPMAIIDIQKDVELKRAILGVISRGNPIIPHPSQEEMSKVGTIHKKFGFKTYKAFNQNARMWHIGFNEGIYTVEFSKVASGGRGFEPDPAKEITFPAGTPVEIVVDKLVEIIQKTHQEIQK